MNARTVQEWLIPVTTAFGIASTSIAAWVGILSYRLKAQAEQRLADTARMERDVALLRLFTDLMNVAHARGTSEISEKAVEFLLKEATIANVPDLLNKAIVTYPIGLAAQEAAIVAIASLGKEHAILKPASIQALETLSKFKPIAVALLQDLEASES